MNRNIKRIIFFNLALNLSRKERSIEKSGNKQLPRKMAGTMWYEKNSRDSFQELQADIYVDNISGQYMLHTLDR
jgi:hypothetical protein